MPYCANCGVRVDELAVDCPRCGRGQFSETPVAKPPRLPRRVPSRRETLRAQHLRLLEQGVASWNRWRIKDPDGCVILEGADLSLKDLREYNLSGASFVRVNLEQADLRGTDLSRANLTEALLRGADLAGANLAGAHLAGADLRNAQLSDCKGLTNSQLNAARVNRHTVLPSLTEASKKQTRADLSSGGTAQFAAPALLAVAMLLIALAPLPYGYYTLLRLVICGVSAYGAYLAHESRKSGWKWVLGLIALVFNPVVPVHLDREVWMPLDLGVAVVLLIAIWRMKTR